MLKAIFFDMNGVTCFEGFKSGVKAYEKEFGIPDGEFYAIIHDHPAWKEFTLGKISEQDYLEACKVRCTAHHFDGKRYTDLVTQNNRPNPDMNTLQRELAKNYTLGIISNNPGEWFDRIIEKLQFNEVMKVRAVSSYLHIRKPDPRIFQYACQEAGVAADEALYVDDREDILEGARSVGMHTFHFTGDIAQLQQTIHIINTQHV